MELRQRRCDLLQRLQVGLVSSHWRGQWSAVLQAKYHFSMNTYFNATILACLTCCTWGWHCAVKLRVRMLCSPKQCMELFSKINGKDGRYMSLRIWDWNESFPSRSRLNFALVRFWRNSANADYKPPRLAGKQKCFAVL